MNAIIASPEKAVSVEPQQSQPLPENSEASWDLWMKEICAGGATSSAAQSPGVVSLEDQLWSCFLDG
jgi:hypothetical protein